MRIVLLTLAVLSYGFTWALPFDSLGVGPFSTHMLRHMVLVAVASPLLMLGLPRSVPIPVSPLIATLLEFLLVWGWHLPRLHDAAQLSTGWLVFEQLSFALAGLLLWGSVLQKGQELAGTGALLMTSMHMTLLGALIVLSPAPLFLCGAEGITPLQDQQLGGIVMLLVGSPVYLVGGLVLMRDVLREPSGYPGRLATGSHTERRPAERSA